MAFVAILLVLLVFCAVGMIVWLRRTFMLLGVRIRDLEIMRAPIPPKERFRTKAPTLYDTTAWPAVGKTQHVLPAVRDALLSPEMMPVLASRPRLDVAVPPASSSTSPIGRVIQVDDEVKSFDRCGNLLPEYSGKFHDVFVPIMLVYQGRWIRRNTSTGESKVIRWMRPGQQARRVTNPLPPLSSSSPKFRPITLTEMSPAQ